ncbi:DUF6783 domain-containing protein [Enterocloster asparagiformis]|uniref:DUF6783 domain-containing protein n=1 Tax=Enterocloster asparagiformis TaxID=333367 RepID=UPI002A7F6748|nr:DUF6783 domain-containing protein [Enterocloster asparagiformis]
MCVPVCGRFVPDEGGVAGYVDRIRDKYTAKWGVQMAGMNFQTYPGTAWAFSGTNQFLCFWNLFLNGPDDGTGRPVAPRLFCGYPHISLRITRPDGMGEHPPNTSILSPPR